jgi:hypothetical protein
MDFTAMTFRKLVRDYFLIGATLPIFVALLSGCVSVSIGPKGPEKSKDVVFTAPKSPYKQVKGLRADDAWQNPENGDSISYFSTCNEQSDPTLENATDEMISAFGETKQLSQKKLEFNGRDALDTVGEARVEGVPTKIHALVFKKNGCLYTLSLIGLAKHFASGEKPFDDFVKGFQAP